MNTAEL